MTDTRSAMGLAAALREGLIRTAREGELLDSLRQAFPFDRYEEVKKGQRGADIVHGVRNPSGKECGKIVWESKNTRAFAGTTRADTEVRPYTWAHAMCPYKYNRDGVSGVDTPG